MLSMIAQMPTLLNGFSGLLLAFVIAEWIIRPKITQTGDLAKLLLHALIIFALSNAALGGVWQVAGAFALACLVIDLAVTWGLPSILGRGLKLFLLDHGARLLAIALALLFWPEPAQDTLWTPYQPLLTELALLASGAVLTIWTGGRAVALLTARFPATQVAENSLPDAGRLIGQLERALIFLLIWADLPTGVGFLVAAKSILRFDAAKDTPQGEYVIIGTLASFGWALAISFATMELLEIARSAP